MEQEVEESKIMAYAAGVIDGDGAIYIQKKNQYWLPIVQIAVSCNDLIMFFLNSFGGTISKSRNLPRWHLRKKKECSEFLQKISKFLVEKREIALAAIKGDFDEVKRLNKWTCQESVENNVKFVSQSRSQATSKE